MKFIVLLMFGLLSSCSGESSEMNSIFHHKPEHRAAFEKALDARGIDYKKEPNGKIWYDRKYREEIISISDAIIESQVSNRYWSSNAEVRSYFMTNLSENGVPYEIIKVDGKDYIVWDELYSDAVSDIRKESLLFEHELKKRAYKEQGRE